jgi:lysozyme family protein
MAWTFENTKAGYLNMWRSVKLKQVDASSIDRFAQKILKAEATYKEVEKVIGVPWFFIGALHMRESSCDFSGVLHNGDKIIGSGRLTYRVPKGRGPFYSWKDSAIDALKLKSLHKVDDWSAERMAYEAERFNGLGYTGKGVNSPYVWAGTNHEQTGKYVADHVWDSDFDDPQIGVMAVIRRLCDIRPDISVQLNGAPLPDVPKPEPSDEKTFWERLTAYIRGE